MELGVISDTHDNIAAVRAATDVFAAAGVETILHLGDVVAPPVIPEFDGFDLHLVFGNNDGDERALTETVEGLSAGSHCHGRFGTLEFDGMGVAMLHGEDLAEVEAYARSGGFDVVLHGHHHEIRDESVNGTRMLNPGAHFPTVPAEHRSVATIDTSTWDVRFHSLDDRVM